MSASFPDVAPAPGIVPGSGTRLSTEQIAEHFRSRLDEGVLDVVDRFGQVVIEVTPEVWVDAVRMANEDTALACDYFEFLDAVDRREEGYEVVVNVYSIANQHRVILKALCPGGRDAPTMPSIAHLYRGANWGERETYDMFGITFEGHPGLEPRILTIENFEGWPLRKDFLLTTREAKPWPGSKEPEERPAAGAAEAGEADAGPSAEDKAAAAKAKAERAKAKAAAMRAKKAAERAAAQRADGGEPAASAAAQQHDAKQDEGEASVAVTEGDAAAQTPEGAADIAQTSAAKDAAAGAVQGDVAAGAPGDGPGADQPVPDPEAEADAAEGAPATASSSPGTEVEGRHGGAEVQGGDVPADQTPGLTSDPQPPAARPAEQYPVPDPGDQSGTGIDEAPESQAREATAGTGEGDAERVTSTPLADDDQLATHEPKETGTSSGRVRSSGEDDPADAGSTDPTRAEPDQPTRGEDDQR